MKAARFYGIQDVRVDEVEIPKAEEDQVLVRVKWCGICGSDLKNFTSGELSRALVQANVAIGITVLGPIGTPTNEHADPYTGKLLPVTLGHEFCGVVEEAPEGCSLAVGQAVVVDPRLYCTTCDMCANGDTNLCNKASFIGLSGSHGGFSGLVPVRWKQCHAIPHSLLDFAALIEPLAVARRALRITGMQDLSGKTALVLGGGPIGQAVIFNLRAMGAKRIFVSEVMASRRKQLEAIAGLDILDPVACDVPAEIRSRMNSDGVHLAIDCAGAAPALAAGLNSLRQKGIFIMVAGSLGSVGQHRYLRPTQN